MVSLAFCDSIRPSPPFTKQYPMICKGHARLFAIALILGAMPSQDRAADIPPVRCFRVQDLAHVGDATTLNTVAIQKAIDACNASGGGVVYFAPGVYLSAPCF